MVDRTRDASDAAGDSPGRVPRGSSAAGAPSAPAEGVDGARTADTSGRGGSRDTGIDPELVDDLGDEFELRGDVMEDALEVARAEAAEWRDKSLRAQADFENTRKRLEVRHADALLRAGERIVEALFPVLDDLDRALDHAVADGSDITEGVEAVRRKLLDVLAREGCTPIDPLGEHFDPARHQAVQMQEDAEVADHTVVDVFQKGFEMHGRVLRPAMVVVSTGGPAGA